MNGRIYDPLVGRFLSGDIWVQFPGDLQSYNRYSYVSNNPLSFFDPTGYAEEDEVVVLPPYVVNGKFEHGGNNDWRPGATFVHEGDTWMVLKRLSENEVSATLLSFIPKQTAADRTNIDVALTPLLLPEIGAELSPQDYARLVAELAKVCADEASGENSGPSETINYAIDKPSLTREIAGWAPVIGSLLDAYDAFKKGNYGGMILNGMLAATDLVGGGALVKGLAVGTMKLASAKVVWKAFLNTRSWKSMQASLVRNGAITKNLPGVTGREMLTTDHILFKQAGRMPHWVLNLPANLQTGVRKSLNSQFEYMTRLERAAHYPTWMRLAAAGFVSYITGGFVDSGSESK